MLQSILSCFACGDKNSSSVVTPEVPIITKVKATPLNESDIKTDDNKSRISMTTVTFFTNQTSPTKDQDDDQQIRRRIQILRKKQLPQRKAMEAQFVRQNLVRSNIIYLIDKKWSQEYTNFLRNQKNSDMPPINNEKLLDTKGELKLNVKEKEDYFIVTQKIWKFVYGLYGGGPTIARDSTFPVYTLSTKRVTLTPVGIQNPLNFCFMNAILQMLLSIEQINGYIIKKQFNDAMNDTKKKTYHNVLYRFIKQYMEAQNQNDSKGVSIKDFASNFQNKFNPDEQHDAHQFLLNFMELLQQQMRFDVSKLAKPTNTPESIYSQYHKQYKSIIDRVFSGQQQTIVTCSSCEFKSMTFLPFLQIVLTIKGMDSIEECLTNYFETEKLQDLYECQKCKKKTKAMKSTCITKTPSYLVIVLAKFSASTLKKIQDRIKYDFQLNLKKHCFGHCGQSTYLLNSLIIHKGVKSNKGHYYTLARRGSKNQWYYLNDNSVKKIEQKQVLGRDAYVLVYQRYKAG